ncbi:MAG: hypothetical protein R3B06_00220 [Kofleriaceae bacterium]
MSTTTTAIRIANDSRFCEARRTMKKLADDLTSPAAMHASLREIAGDRVAGIGSQRFGGRRRDALVGSRN